MGVVHIKVFLTAQNLRQILLKNSSPEGQGSYHFTERPASKAVNNSGTGLIMRVIGLPTGFTCERTQREEQNSEGKLRGLFILSSSI